MQWEFILALVIAVPIILVPVVFVWYLSIGGIRSAIKESHRRRMMQVESPAVTEQVARRPAERELVGSRR